MVSLLLAFLILLFRKKEYVSTATALPASSVSADRARIFNRNIQQLYSAMGSPDELDRMLGTSRLDTLYRVIEYRFDLKNHYRIKGKHPEFAAVQELKNQTKVMKSDWGELKVKVWDEDPRMASNLANAFIQQLDSFHMSMLQQQNHSILDKLKTNLVQLKSKLLFDSTSASHDL
jgi:hypothetical protein